MPEAYIGLGSNLGSQSGGIHKTPRDQINNAIETMSKNPDISLIAISSYYQTSAIGPGEQPDYINAAIKIKTNLDPYVLLDILQIIEIQQWPNTLRFFRVGMHHNRRHVLADPWGMLQS